MKRNGTKIFLLTSLIAFGSLILIGIITILALSFFAPKTMANFTYSLGMNDASLFYLEKQSNKTNDINDVYQVLNLSIKLNKKSNIEKYYEKLEKDAEYKNFILNINLTNKNSDMRLLEKAMLFNEDQYLKNKYVSALVSMDKIDKAFNYALKNYVNFKSYNYNNQGIYLFDDFFDKLNVAAVNKKITTVYENFFANEESYNVIQAIVINFQNFANDFLENIEKLSNEKKVPLLALGFKINTMAENITQFNDLHDSGITTEEVNAIVRDVNVKMAELII